ncbi:unnamed protein product [Amoebophrya sp. A25]|nr:unnamed protein product [Amoebophrya sp. A25]|eukprot:GSA25T00014085001.1
MELLENTSQSAAASSSSSCTSGAFSSAGSSSSSISGALSSAGSSSSSTSSSDVKNNTVDDVLQMLNSALDCIAEALGFDSCSSSTKTKKFSTNTSNANAKTSTSASSTRTSVIPFCCFFALVCAVLVFYDTCNIPRSKRQECGMGGLQGAISGMVPSLFPPPSRFQVDDPYSMPFDSMAGLDAAEDPYQALYSGNALAMPVTSPMQCTGIARLFDHKGRKIFLRTFSGWMSLGAVAWLTSGYGSSSLLVYFLLSTAATFHQASCCFEIPEGSMQHMMPQGPACYCS